MSVMPPTDYDYYHSALGWQSSASNLNFVHVFDTFYYSRVQRTTLRIMNLRSGEIYNLEDRSPVPSWNNLGHFSGAVDVSPDGKYVIYSYGQGDVYNSATPYQWFTVIREISELLPSEPYDMSIRTPAGGFKISGELLKLTYIESAMVRLELVRDGVAAVVYLDLESRVEIPEPLFERLRKYYRGTLPEDALIQSILSSTLSGGGVRSEIVVSYKNIAVPRRIASERFIFEQKGAQWLLKQVWGYDPQGMWLMWKKYFYGPNGRLFFVLVWFRSWWAWF